MPEHHFESLGIDPVLPFAGSTLGFATHTLGSMPINGLRHPVEGDTNGWYIWCGEYSEETDFFKTLCVEHLQDYLPQVQKYLSLPPGYRFQVDAAGYEDVWYDETLLNIE